MDRRLSFSAEIITGPSTVLLLFCVVRYRAVSQAVEQAPETFHVVRVQLLQAELPVAIGGRKPAIKNRGPAQGLSPRACRHGFRRLTDRSDLPSRRLRVGHAR